MLQADADLINNSPPPSIRSSHFSYFSPLIMTSLFFVVIQSDDFYSTVSGGEGREEGKEGRGGEGEKESEGREGGRREGRERLYKTIKRQYYYILALN